MAGNLKSAFCSSSSYKTKANKYRKGSVTQEGLRCKRVLYCEVYSILFMAWKINTLDHSSAQQLVVGLELHS